MTDRSAQRRSRRQLAQKPARGCRASGLCLHAQSRAAPPASMQQRGRRYRASPAIRSRDAHVSIVALIALGFKTWIAPLGTCSAGGGTRTRTPPRGAPDFKSGAYSQFRHPGAGSVASPGYWPGAMSLTLWYRSPALLRCLSRNLVKAPLSNDLHMRTNPWPGSTLLKFESWFWS